MFRSIPYHTFILLLILSSFYIDVLGQEVFDFDGKNSLVSVSGQSSFRLRGRSGLPELTEGLKGKGLRTDGYSSFLQSDILSQKEIKGISGSFALESFPTDTAGFFSVADTANHFYAGLCADRFGDLILSISKNKETVFIPTGMSVKKFTWVNLGMEFTKTGVSVLIDGRSVPISYPMNFTYHINRVLIGKDFRTKRIGMLNLTTINGLIDEVSLWDTAIDTKLLMKGIASNGSKIPKLAIPFSRFEHDFSRPKYHLLPGANWTNETHGLLFYKGKYHIFNQKNASGLSLSQINWGHFSSPDLINWIEHKPALSPEKGYDENGIWSGHILLDDKGTPVISYTAGGPKMAIALAYPKDSSLIEWEKYKYNPVIPGQPEGYTRTDLRDTYVWKEGKKWYMVVGFGIEEETKQRGALLLYTSDNLQQWRFLHTLFEGVPDKDGSGIFWEMPVFKKMGNKYVLLVNRVPDKGIPARALYWVGDFVNERFVPDHQFPQNLEVINRLLSPSVTEDEKGRITAIAIIPDEISGEAAYYKGWSHLYSIPRVWNLAGGKLFQSPHPALKSLRASASSKLKATIAPDQPVKLSSGTLQYELIAEIDPAKAEKFGFVLHKNPDGSEFSKIYYDVTLKEIVVDQRHSSIKIGIPQTLRRDALALNTSAPVRFHVFVDGSVVEIFINDQYAFTTRIFPSKESSDQLEIFSEGGDIKVKTELWNMNPAKMTMDF